MYVYMNHNLMSFPTGWLMIQFPNDTIVQTILGKWYSTSNPLVLQLGYSMPLV